MSEFWLDFISFLGHVVEKNGIMVDPAKITGIYDWSIPTSPIEI